MPLWLWIVLGCVVLLGLIVPSIIAAVIYNILLVRTSPEKWIRKCSWPDDPEYAKMYDQALQWGEKHKDRIRDVSITSDGLKLCGQYVDFGFDRTVIIIPGRTEGCYYCYYFAEPYRVAGYNILAIDNRSHGLSEGKRISFGVKEHRDIIAWSKFLHEELGNTQVIIHGICIGSSVGLYALVSPQCPDYLVGMTCEGMYTTFYESFNQHMVEFKQPIFPTSMIVMAYIRLFSGANVMTDGPIKQIRKLQKPILFLHSKEDTYSLPHRAQVLYDLCPSEKNLVWFDKGAHSRIRINLPEEYDRAIMDYWKNREISVCSAQVVAVD